MMLSNPRIIAGKGDFYCLNSVLLRAELWSIYIIIHKIRYALIINGLTIYVVR